MRFLHSVRAGVVASAVAAVLVVPSVLNAQSVVNPVSAEFTPSTDHNATASDGTPRHPLRPRVLSGRRRAAFSGDVPRQTFTGSRRSDSHRAIAALVAAIARRGGRIASQRCGSWWQWGQRRIEHIHVFRAVHICRDAVDTDDCGDRHRLARERDCADGMRLDGAVELRLADDLFRCVWHRQRFCGLCRTADTSTTSRSGTLTVAGLTITVTQTGGAVLVWSIAGDAGRADSWRQRDAHRDLGDRVLDRVEQRDVAPEYRRRHRLRQWHGGAHGGRQYIVRRIRTAAVTVSGRVRP